MITLNEIIILVSGFIAGTIDAIAGGGGLITLPAWISVLGDGAHSVATNKIPAVAGTLVALLVYSKNAKVSLLPAVLFVVAISIGSSMGALVAPHMPKEIFRTLLLFFSPVLLAVIWKKSIWLKVAKEMPNTVGLARSIIVKNQLSVVVTGMCVGFYDGFFGPGGGTFMLLGLLFVCKFPLMQSLIYSKLANLVSASSSLVTYSVAGLVYWKQGLVMAIGMSIGCYIGAKFATKRAEKVVRPVLVLVVLLLMFSLIKQKMG